MAVKNCRVEDMVASPAFGRERYRTLSHRWLPMAGGDCTSMRQCEVLRRSILTTHEKLMNSEHFRQSEGLSAGPRAACSGFTVPYLALDAAVVAGVLQTTPDRAYRNSHRI